MRETIQISGMVLSSMAVGDYDKRLVILSKERGRITAFARGARKQNSSLMACTRPFAFGSFSVYEGRDAYTLQSAEISCYFEELSSDMEAISYGFYLLEFAGYYTRENENESQMLYLLYLSIKALLNKHLENRLVKVIFELRSMQINGEYPQVFTCGHCGKELTNGYFSSSKSGMVCSDCKATCKDGIWIGDAATYAMQFILSSPIQKLYTFTLSHFVLNELERVTEMYKKRYIDREFQSLSILKTITT